MADGGLSRGKTMLRSSLIGKAKPPHQRRWSPDQDAQFWSEAGLDKDGFLKRFISKSVGHGVFATKDFNKGDFLLEYVGRRYMYNREDMSKLYKKYRNKQHNYLYHYRFNDRDHCIDATDTRGHLCQIVNDRPENHPGCNGKMKLKVFSSNYPRLCLFALRDIRVGEEITFDYGDPNAPWRRKDKRCVSDAESDDVDDDPFGLLENESSGLLDDDDAESDDVDDDPFGLLENESSGLLEDDAMGKKPLLKDVWINQELTVTQSDEGNSGTELQADEVKEMTTVQLDDGNSGAELQADEVTEMTTVQLDDGNSGTELQADEVTKMTTVQLDDGNSGAELQADEVTKMTTVQLDDGNSGAELQADEVTKMTTVQLDDGNSGAELQADEVTKMTTVQLDDGNSGAELQADEVTKMTTVQLDDGNSGAELQADEVTEMTKVQLDDGNSGAELQADEVTQMTTVQLDDGNSGAELQVDEVTEVTVMRLDEGEKRAELQADEVTKMTTVQLDEGNSGTELQADEVTEVTVMRLDEGEKRAELQADEVTKMTTVQLDDGNSGAELQADEVTEMTTVQLDDGNSGTELQADEVTKMTTVQLDDGNSGDELQADEVTQMTTVQLDDGNSGAELQADEVTKMTTVQLDDGNSGAELQADEVTQMTTVQLDDGNSGAELQADEVTKMTTVQLDDGNSGTELQADEVTKMTTVQLDDGNSGTELQADEVTEVTTVQLDDGNSGAELQADEVTEMTTVQLDDGNSGAELQADEVTKMTTVQLDDGNSGAELQADEVTEMTTVQLDDGNSETELQADEVTEVTIMRLDEGEKRAELQADGEDSCDSSASNVFPNFDCFLKPNAEVYPRCPQALLSTDESVSQRFHEKDADNENDEYACKDESETEDHSPGTCKQAKKNCHTDSSKRHYEKPKRFCVYCHEIILGGKLRRHIRLAHKNNAEVKEVLQMPREQQNRFFEEKRIAGIYEYNIKILATSELHHEKEEVMRERKPKCVDEVRMCSGCNRFFSNRAYYKHQHVCSKTEAQPLKLNILAPKSLHKDEAFVTEILSRLRDTEAGNLCRQDPLIQQIGYRHFCLRRGEKSKKDEIKKAVMCEMREMARLFLKFRSLTNSDVTTQDMFTRKYLSKLRDAIEAMSQSDNDKHGKEKYGLKLNLNSIVQRAIKSLKGFYTESLQDDLYDEVCKFQMAYAFRSHEMFSNARYQCIASSMDKARRPAHLPVENELKKLKDFISERLKYLEKNFQITEYSSLRSLVVCRLTLYNGRRGEEPSRMLIKEWEDAMDGVWLPPENIEAIEDPAEQFLIGQFHLAYLYGKGKKFVPVLIPKDIVNVVQILLENRQGHGIRSDNQFLFASKKSSSHCSGWHAVQQVAKEANVSINATRNRHRISTIYASLDMTQQDQRVFMDHMGHDSAINAENYQCPLGVKEVRVMGKVLNQIDADTTEPVHVGTCRPRKRRAVVMDSSDEENEDQSDIIEQERTYRPRKRRAVVMDSSDEENEDQSDTNEPVKKKAGRIRKISMEEDIFDDQDVEKVKKVLPVSWTEADTQEIKKHFKSFFDSGLSQNQNKGKLPSKSEIMDFLRTNLPECLKHLDLNAAYKKTRAKLFNERKTQRDMLRKNMKKLL